MTHFDRKKKKEEEEETRVKGAGRPQKRRLIPPLGPRCHPRSPIIRLQIEIKWVGGGSSATTPRTAAPGKCRRPRLGSRLAWLGAGAGHSRPTVSATMCSGSVGHHFSSGHYCPCMYACMSVLFLFLRCFSLVEHETRLILRRY